jgi:DNA modification methylase
LEVLRELPSESVQCCVTSPPYWGLRDYGIPPSVWPVQRSQGVVRCSNGDHLWGETISVNATNHTDKRRWQHTRNGRDEEQPTEKRVAWLRTEVPQGEFCKLCGAWAGALGLEPTPELFVSHAVSVFHELRRVLRDDGTLWLNMGDSYNAHPNQRSVDDLAGWKQQSNPASRAVGSRYTDSMKPKDLVGMPWTLALALRSDGWYLRQDIVWSKPNPMPESVTDRCTKAHEYLFLLTKSARYYFDQNAILEPVSANTHARLSQDVEKQIGSERANGGSRADRPMKAVARSRESWNGSRFDDERDLKIRPNTGRKRAAAGSGIKNNDSFADALALQVEARNKRSVWTVNVQGFSEAHFATFPEDLIKPCILAGCKSGEIVLDPFGGSGTTALVAQALHCRAILIELNADYIEIAKKRLKQDVFQFVPPEESWIGQQQKPE